MNLHLTADGIDALLYCVTEQKTLNFVSVVIGNGQMAADGIRSPIAEFTELSVERSAEENTVIIKVSFTNENSEIFAESKHVTEMGVYITDPGNNSNKLLYACGKTSLNSSMYIPATAEGAFGLSMTLKLYVSNEAETTASFDQSMVYATKGQLTTLQERVTAIEQRIDLLADWADVSITTVWSERDAEGGENTYGYLTVSAASGSWADGTAVAFAELPEYEASEDVDCYAVFTVDGSTKEVSVTLYCYGTATEPDAAWGANYVKISGTQSSAYTAKIYTR